MVLLFYGKVDSFVGLRVGVGVTELIFAVGGAVWSIFCKVGKGLSKLLTLTTFAAASQPLLTGNPMN